uniref:Guanylate cyclase n=1 Tax=Cyclophora tenuis TaxID=216820 RepID=A0A7S1DAK1_CYCTE
MGKGDEYARLKADFIHEMRHLSKLRHPCITTVMGAVISNKSEPMLVMEYMDHGSLYDLLHNDSVVIDGELVLPILRDIAQGVRFLHAANPQVIHGDLKAQNVLVDSKFRAKVADFGLSQKKRVGATGTPLWMAPELLRGESDNTDASDVYSFGIMLYEVYSRKDPYEGEDHLQVLRAVADTAVNKRPPVPMECPPKVASIMTDCLAGEPSQRPTFEELDLRLRRLDVENVEPGKATAVFSSKRDLKDVMAARNEELLFDVFPRHVAEALRDGRRVEAEAFDCVTIFFSDIVGYTTISANLTPKKVSEMLDRLYLKFDALSSQHDVFKIETIGDAYMAVTNLASQQEDHVARIASFAMDAMTAAQDTLIDIDEPSKGYVNIRVGFHSGPIVADVIGSRCPKYTLFGDTVNTAARMESNSLPGRIQCSDRSAELLMAQSSEIPMASRGKINIKGKGEMYTYWVNETPDETISVRGGTAPSRTLDAISENGVPAM